MGRHYTSSDIRLVHWARLYWIMEIRCQKWCYEYILCCRYCIFVHSLHAWDLQSNILPWPRSIQWCSKLGLIYLRRLWSAFLFRSTDLFFSWLSAFPDNDYWSWKYVCNLWRNWLGCTWKDTISASSWGTFTCWSSHYNNIPHDCISFCTRFDIFDWSSA